MSGTEKAVDEHVYSRSTPSSISINRDASVVVVMGVSGSGKSTLGRSLAHALALPFVDADDLHPADNVAKMGRGEALGDDDRWAWLERVREVAVRGCSLSVRAPAAGSGGAPRGAGPGIVVACSALKRAYRAVLRGEVGASPADETPPSVSTYFVFLEGGRDVLMARMLRRQGHFMKAGMLDSQLETLESPVGEPGVVTVSVDMSTEEQVQRVVEALGWGSS